MMSALTVNCLIALCKASFFCGIRGCYNPRHDFLGEGTLRDDERSAGF